MFHVKHCPEHIASQCIWGDVMFIKSLKISCSVVKSRLVIENNKFYAIITSHYNTIE